MLQRHLSAPHGLAGFTAGRQDLFSRRGKRLFADYPQRCLGAPFRLGFAATLAASFENFSRGLGRIILIANFDEIGIARRVIAFVIGRSIRVIGLFPRAPWPPPR